MLSKVYCVSLSKMTTDYSLHFMTVIVYTLILAASCSKTINMTVVQSETLRLNCIVNRTTIFSWDHNGDLMFRNRLNLGHKLGDNVHVVENGTLIIENIQLHHEGTYRCYDTSGTIASYQLQVAPRMYITLSDRKVSSEIFIEATKHVTLTCHADRVKPKTKLTWQHDNTTVISLQGNLTEKHDDNETSSFSLPMTLEPLTETTYVTCLGRADTILDNLNTSLKIIAFGPITMTVNGRFVETTLSMEKDEQIFIECKLNESLASFTWEWIDTGEKDKVSSTLTGGIVSSNYSTSLQIPIFQNEVNLSCIGNSGVSAGSIILQRNILITLKEKKDFILTWQLAVLVAVPILIVPCLIILISYRCKIEKRDELPLSFNVPMNEDVVLQDQLQICLPGPSRKVDQPVCTNDILRNITLTTRLSSSGPVEYWLATTENAWNATVIAKFMRETATISQLLTFHALAKNLVLLTEHENVVKLLHVEVNEVQCCMYCEYTGTNNLRDYLLSVHGGTPNTNMLPQLMRFAVNIADAMEFLKSNKFSHPALSSRKVLITDKGVCKVYDIWQNELASHRVSVILTKENAISAWLAPETLLFGQYSDKSDIWSFGVLLWEIFSYGETPYRYCSKDEIETFVRTSNNLLQPTTCPGGIYGIMLSTWEITDSKRPSLGCIKDKLCRVMAKTDQNYGDSEFDDAFYSSYNCLYHDVNETDR